MTLLEIANMTERFVAALEILDNPDRSLKPAQLAAARDAALVEGLRGLAEAFGKQIEPVRWYANGEINFFITGEQGSGEGRPSGQYGEEIAALLCQFPVRTGQAPTKGYVLPVNGWCYIQRRDAESMLRLAREVVAGCHENDLADAPRL